MLKVQSKTFNYFSSGIVESFEATAKYSLLNSLQHAYWRNANKEELMNKTDACRTQSNSVRSVESNILLIDLFRQHLDLGGSE